MGVALPILKAGQKSLRKSPGRVGCARAERLATESHHRQQIARGLHPAGRLADAMGTQWMGRLVL
jgi:hypothetical protein